jgi:hypothetical protein
MDCLPPSLDAKVPLRPVLRLPHLASQPSMLQQITAEVEIQDKTLLKFNTALKVKVEPMAIIKEVIVAFPLLQDTSTLIITRLEDSPTEMWLSINGQAQLECLMNLRKALIKTETSIRSTDGLIRMGAHMKLITGMTIKLVILINATGGLINKELPTRLSMSLRRTDQSLPSILPRIKMEKFRKLMIVRKAKNQMKVSSLWFQLFLKASKVNKDHTALPAVSKDPLFILPIVQPPIQTSALINDTYIFALASNSFQMYYFHTNFSIALLLVII